MITLEAPRLGAFFVVAFLCKIKNPQCLSKDSLKEKEE